MLRDARIQEELSETFWNAGVSFRYSRQHAGCLKAPGAMQAGPAEECGVQND